MPTTSERSTMLRRVRWLLIVTCMGAFVVPIGIIAACLFTRHEQMVSRRQMLIRLADPIGVKRVEDATDDLSDLGFTKIRDDKTIRVEFFSGHLGSTFSKCDGNQIVSRSTYERRLTRGVVLSLQITLYRNEGEDEICAEIIYLVPHTPGSETATPDSLSVLDDTTISVQNRIQACDRSGRKSVTRVEHIWR
jgi:hypothetical protein